MEPFIEAILNVLTIIALIAAVAFIIILLVDLFLSITNRKGSIFFRGRADNDDVIRPVVKPNNEATARPTVLEADESRLQAIQNKSWDENQANLEQMEIMNNQANKLSDEEELRLAKEKDLENARNLEIEQKKNEFDSFDEFDEFDDFDSLFEEQNQKAEEPAPFIEETPAEPEFNFEDMINEINSESVTVYNESKVNEVIVPEIIENPQEEYFEQQIANTEEEVSVTQVEENTETQSVENTEEETIITPIVAEEVVTTETENPIVETEAKTEIVEEETLISDEPKKEILNVYEYFPIDALNERLAKLQERLKINEKDLKGNRKEYNPLARVQRSLKRDQEKLRRREAIIARKKVMLYGVNNYVDIDEEKAKKLSEDLDLLDGLRLSVQHCEEVMEQNKERFPILEKTNQILVAQNKQIKEDIAEVKAAIARLQEENN